MINIEKIEIFSGPGCKHCEVAKAMLREHDLAFVERDISAPEDVGRTATAVAARKIDTADIRGWRTSWK